MRLLWVDATAGAAGDMLLGAMFDLGLPVARLRRALATLPLEGWSLRSRKVSRRGLAGRFAEVRVKQEGPARRWRDLRRIIEAGDLTPEVRRRSLEVFRRLIEAEAEAHGVDAEEVHLHEAGATDAVVDIVGACFGLEQLGVERVVVSPMTTGWGTVRCAHGDYPVPGPATLLLVRGCPVRAGDVEVERLTPTGAALLTGLADDWGPLPLMFPSRVGYGAGRRELATSPNMLRLVLGTEAGTESSARDARLGQVLVLQCTVDDVTPQTLAHVCERALAAGALEAYVSPATMKKGRSGHELTVLARPDRLEELSRLILEETGSLGLRLRREERIELAREKRQVPTPWGPVGIKSGYRDGREIRAWPEHDDCARLAIEGRVTLREIRQSALDAHRAAARSAEGTGSRSADGPTRKRRRKSAKASQHQPGKPNKR